MRPRTLSLAVVAMCVATAVHALHEPPTSDLDRKIDLELAGAAPADVFASFASILEAELELDPKVTGEITIELHGVSVMTSLEAVCEMLGCVFGIDQGPPRRLVVRADRVVLGIMKSPPDPLSPHPADLDTPIDLSLRQAAAREVLESIARIGGWQLHLVRPTVSIELYDSPVRQALDEICAQVGCVWSLDERGEKGVLRVEFPGP